MVYIDENVIDLDVCTALENVSEQRRDYALSFKSLQDQKRALSVYLLLKQGLNKEYGISENPIFEFEENGKPFMPAHPDVFFSLSHSKTVALCAISDKPIGADVEVVRKISADLMEYTMNDEELKFIQNHREPNLAFFCLWTRKEAFLKLLGRSITADLKDILRCPNIKLETFIQNNYVYSLATNVEK